MHRKPLKVKGKTTVLKFKSPTIENEFTISSLETTRRISKTTIQPSPTFMVDYNKKEGKDNTSKGKTDSSKPNNGMGKPITP